MKKTKNGFTLIELLVVVLIIGILAAVALPKYQKAVIKSRAASFPTWAKRVYAAQQLHLANTGTYATSFADLPEEDFSSEFPVVPTGFSWASGQLAQQDNSSPYGIRLFTNQCCSGAMFNNVWTSGKGGFVIEHTGPHKNKLLCVEYALHAVEEGSFCREIMGYPTLLGRGCCGGGRIYE